MDGRIDRVIMRNERTQAEILKIDAETGEAVSGAVLQIRDQEGKVIEEWISGTESHWVIGRLAAGEVYELWEKEAPEGYQLAGKMEFTMQKKAEVLKLSYKNRKKTERRINRRNQTGFRFLRSQRSLEELRLFTKARLQKR